MNAVIKNSKENYITRAKKAGSFPHALKNRPLNKTVEKKYELGENWQIKWEKK